MQDESYRKVKNQNLLSHKEIKELTMFFLKQPAIKVLEKLIAMKEHVTKLGKRLSLKVGIDCF